MSDEPGAERGRFWRRMFAFIIDAVAIGAVLAAFGISLFGPTEGRIRVTNVLVNVRSCHSLNALPAGLSLPKDFKVTQAARCTSQFLGWVHDRVMVVSEVTRSGAVSYTRSVTFAVDADGRPMRAFYLDYLVVFLLAGYLLLLEWRFGTTLGKNLLDVRVHSLGGGPLTLLQAAKRMFVRLLPAWILTAALLPVIWLDAGMLFSLMNYLLVVYAVGAALGLVLLVNFILTVRRGNLPWHDRWAGTEVVRGR
jgi:uncharacterized RDD family membrane protein YckC